MIVTLELLDLPVELVEFLKHLNSPERLTRPIVNLRQEGLCKSLPDFYKSDNQEYTNESKAKGLTR